MKLFQKIELKVSANCCEGCKKKVKRALRRIEGVLKTDIDPLQPKVTVLGNVNLQILIKRLLKVGKHAALCSYEELEAEKKEAEIAAITKEKEKQNSGRREEKQLDSSDIKIEKTKEIKEGGSGGKNPDPRKENKDLNSYMTADACNLPHDMKKENPRLPHPEGISPLTHKLNSGFIRACTHTAASRLILSTVTLPSLAQ